MCDAIVSDEPDKMKSEKVCVGGFGEGVRWMAVGERERGCGRQKEEKGGEMCNYIVQWGVGKRN